MVNHTTLKNVRLLLLMSVLGTCRFALSFAPAKQRIRGHFAGTTSKLLASSFSEFQQLLLSRRTVNNFEPTLPSDWESAVERAVVAATFAPNHKRTEPWRFHLLGPHAIRHVCELNAEIVSASKGKEAGEKKFNRWLAIPGWLVVTCVRSADNDHPGDATETGTSGYMDAPTGLAREDYAACCCAIQNMCLSLHAEQIGTKWTTGAVNFDSRFAEAAGLPANEYVVGTIWFGTATNTPKVPTKKLSLEGVFSRHD